jgi:hypothetical protein
MSALTTDVLAWLLSERTAARDDGYSGHLALVIGPVEALEVRRMLKKVPRPNGVVTNICPNVFAPLPPVGEAPPEEAMTRGLIRLLDDTDVLETFAGGWIRVVPREDATRAVLYADDDPNARILRIDRRSATAQ